MADSQSPEIDHSRFTPKMLYEAAWLQKLYYPDDPKNHSIQTPPNIKRGEYYLLLHEEQTYAIKFGSPADKGIRDAYLKPVREDWARMEQTSPDKCQQSIQAASKPEK